jgi:hypothetical protein
MEFGSIKSAIASLPFPYLIMLGLLAFCAVVSACIAMCIGLTVVLEPGHERRAKRSRRKALSAKEPHITRHAK